MILLRTPGWVGVWLVVGAMGCGDSHPVDEATDAGGGDSSVVDLGGADAEDLDGGGGEDGATDGGAPDAGGLDSGAADAGSPDLGPPDSGPSDMGPSDSGSPDVGPPDMGCPDADADGICDADDRCAGGLTETLFFEDFASAPHAFTLNTNDVGSGSGDNQWMINPVYTGGSGSYVCGFVESYTVPGTPPQPSGVVGGPFSAYLHTVGEHATDDHIYNASFFPMDGSCASASSVFARMSTDANVTGLDEVEVSFYWALGGGAGIHGEVYFSLNGGGSWTKINAPPALLNQPSWTHYSVTLPVMGASTLRLGYRFVTNPATTFGGPGFSIDDVAITCHESP